MRAATVRLERDARRATIVLDRPPLNVLDLEALAELATAVESAASTPGLGVVVLRSAHQRAFSAGVAIEDHTRDKVPTMLERFHRAIRGLLALDLPTVAAVRGHCLGGGLELALACDLVVAAEDARFGLPEIKLACFPPIATALLPARLGPAVAADLVLTGRTFDVAEAERLGLVSRRVPAEGLDAAVDALVAELAAHSAAALAVAKRALRAGRDRPFDAALAEAERLYLDDLLPTADIAEGVAAFAGRRPPRWVHH